VIQPFLMTFYTSFFGLLEYEALFDDKSKTILKSTGMQRRKFLKLSSTLAGVPLIGFESIFGFTLMDDAKLVA